MKIKKRNKTKGEKYEDYIECYCIFFIIVMLFFTVQFKPIVKYSRVIQLL